MVNYLRYALAAFCFAASVGCLALWRRSMSTQDVLIGPSYVRPTVGLLLDAVDGVGIATVVFESSRNSNPPPFNPKWKYLSRQANAIEGRREQMEPMFEQHGAILLSFKDGMAYCALWYPALVFALAGVGVLRCRRQFSIRSALICVSVVAALLGIVVAL